MRYISTRGGAESRSFSEILLEGLAPDGGLYVPNEYPKIDLDELQPLSYLDVALEVLSRFAPDIPHSEIERILRSVYSPRVFGSEEITPIRTLSKEEGLHLQGLSNGPTLAFKDVPLQLVAALMQYVLGKENGELNILGATSGDTGSAAAYAVKGKKALRLFMLSPYGRMSKFQQKQMYTLHEPNVFNLVVNGTFDDCQAVVKQVNADAEFKKKYKIGAVNSINWARIAAQVVYYVYGYLRVAEKSSEPVTFAVPSGNFGNALSAWIATQMGVPIQKIFVCTNYNDVLDEFFKTGTYRVRKGSEVKITSSPSMDIASASNFERFVFDLADRNALRVQWLWSDLAGRGQFDGRHLDSLNRSNMLSGSATDLQVLEIIRYVYRRYGVVIDPHTAVAMEVGLRYQRNGDQLVVLETAQPAKFADTIREAIGIEPPVPKGYERLGELPEFTTRIDPDPEVVKRFIAAHVGD